MMTQVDHGSTKNDKEIQGKNATFENYCNNSFNIEVKSRFEYVIII